MDADQKALWRRANAVFAALLKAEPDDVSAWLEAQGLEPPELEMVHRLLEAHEQEEGPLDRSAAQWVGSGGGNGDVADEGADPLLGREISGWHLKSVLGRGGMATVYLARRQADGYEQQAALKLLRLGLLTAEGRERFTREKQILAELSHRNIARLLDAGTADDGTPYLVMEYAEGVRVDTYVRENHLSTRACVALLVPICETVAFAQQHMVVHRDLKPSNIVIDAEGNPKLLDFGIARLLVSEGADSTTTRAFTPGFAAPEQFSGAPVSAATDVYGLGACLLRLLAPAEESPGPVLGVPRWNEPSIHRDLDPDLRNILGKTLKEDPAERYRDARELADELKAWLAGKPVQATGDSFTYRVRKFVGRNRIGVAAAGAVVLALIAGVGSTLWQAERARQNAEVAQQEAARATAVREFLVGLFRASLAGVEQATLPTTEELLEEGARRATEDFDDQPVLKAEMLAVLGEILETRNRHDDAIRMLEEAVRIGTSGADVPPKTVGTAQSVLALALVRTNRFEEAAEVGAAAMETLRPEAPSEIGPWAGAASRQISYLVDLERYDEALEVAERVEQTVRAYAPDDDALAYRAATAYGRALEGLGELERAYAKYLEAQAKAEQLEFFYSEIDALLSVNARKLERMEAALGHAKDHVAMVRRAYPEGHATIGRSLNILASIQSEMGQLEAAEATTAEALEIMRATLGPDDLAMASAYNNWGALLDDLGRSEQALEVKQQAVAIVKKHLGVQDWRYLLVVRNMARSMIELGQFDAAEAVLNEIEAHSRDPGNEKDAVRWNSMQAKLNLEAGRPAQAYDYTRQLPEPALALFPEQSSFVLHALGQAGYAAALNEHWDAAAGHFEKAQALFLERADGLDFNAAEYLALRTRYLSLVDDAESAGEQLRADLDRLYPDPDKPRPFAERLLKNSTGN